MTENLLQALKYKDLYSVKLIAVSINSPGGSIVQAKNVNNILRKFSRKTGAPVYTFVEQFALNSANIIATGGNKCFANKFSIMGDFGFYTKKFGYKDLMNEWNVQGEYLSSGKDKVKLNPLEDLQTQDGAWLENILKGLETELKNEIRRNRGEHFDHKNVSQEALDTEILNASYFNSNIALKYGFIDGVSTLQNVLSDKYDDVKRIDIMKRSRFDDRVAKTEFSVMSGLSNTIPK